MEEFPGNAHRNKPKPGEVPPEKKVEKVVQGEVIEKKKSFGAKLKEVFIGSDGRSTASYVASEVLLPALRSLIVEVTSRGIERVIYGDNAPQRPGTIGGLRGQRIQYNTPVNRYGPMARGPLPGQAHEIRPRGYDIKDIVVFNRSDAEAILDHMASLIETWGYATVADLKNLAGLAQVFTDEGWGWKDPNCIGFQQVSDGWLITTTNPEPV